MCTVLCCAVLCFAVLLHCTAAQSGKKDSFFLANDPKLLDIMDRQGLQFALHSIPAVKDHRLGYTHSMGDFLERMMVKSGNVNEACGASPTATPAFTAGQPWQLWASECVR
jgi:hypothetical protein